MKRGDRVRTAIGEIRKRIHSAEKSKKEFFDYLKKLKEAYSSGEISYSTYIESLYAKREGRNISEWIEYFDKYKKECGREIKKHQIDIVKRQFIIIFFSAALIFSLLILSFYIQPKFVGFVIQEPKIISEINATITTTQEQAVLNQPVKWKKEIIPENTGNITITLPEQSENVEIRKIKETPTEPLTQIQITGAVISTREGFLTRFYKNLQGKITGKIISESTQEKSLNIQIDEITNYEIVYETPAPYSTEQEIERGKKITIISPESIHYENVLAFTALEKEVSKEKIKLYRTTNGIRESTAISNYIDENNNGLIDKIEFIVPSLSEQTYELIIEISKAEHLDSNRQFISDIYEQVRVLDNVWSEEIPSGDYVRVTFETLLTSSRDITLYPRVTSGEPRIEVYEKDKNDIIAEFTNISSNEYNKVYLTNLGHGQCYDNETEILTDKGWKLFSEMTKEEKVITLNQETGKQEWKSPSNWQEFEHDEEMYRIVYEDGSELRVSPKHRVYAGYDNSESNISLGEKTLISFEDNNPLSPEKIGQLSAAESATYGTSLLCRTNCFALGKNFKNSSEGMKCISLIKKLYTSSNSCSESLVNFSIFDLFFLTSSSRNSGATNSNFSRIELNKKTEYVTPLFIKEEITTLASTTNLSGISYPLETNLSYLLDNELLISSANLSACDCVNLDFETALLNLTIPESLSFNKLLTSIDISMLGSALNSDSSSSGILTLNSAMNNGGVKEYINFSEFKLELITKVYEQINQGKEIYFLDENNEPVKVKSIEKIPYNGKIYGVDVENDIVLVRGKTHLQKLPAHLDSQIDKEQLTEDLVINNQINSEPIGEANFIEINGKLIDVTGAVWSGNSESYSQDTFDLRVVDGSVEFDYIVDPQIWFEDCVDISDWTIEPSGSWSGDPCTATNGASENITRGPSDASGATSMNVSFDWTANKIDADEYLKLHVSSDGSAYTNVWTKEGTGAAESGSANVDISSYISSTVYIRFECKSGGGEGCNVDNINLSTIMPVDENYPQFSNYWDNNATLVGSGTGLFNVTVISTNGTVLLEINGVNVTAKNLTANVYNASYEFSSDGVYPYRWHSWGNGTSSNYNVSDERSYTVNISYGTLDVNISYPIGFEYLDSNGNVVNVFSAIIVHTWNTKHDYFFNKSSGIQFTNNFQDYWTRNIFCGGYKNLSNWVYECNDKLPFNWDIITDNSTYVNMTGYKDFDVSGKQVRVAIRYHLKLEDESLTIQFYIKNIGTSDINTDLGFAWRVEDIKIGGNVENDWIKINDSEYSLNDNLNLNFTNMNRSYYYMYDIGNGRYLRLDWNKNLNYKVNIISEESQYNAPTTLSINIGTLNIGQEKFTEMYWIDAFTWASKLLFSFDDDDGAPATYTAEILDSGNAKPNFAGTLTNFSVKIDVTTGTNIDDGEGTCFYHCEDSGCTNSYFIGCITGTQLNTEGIFWVNSTDATLLARIEHDGIDSEFLKGNETADGLDGGENLNYDAYVEFTYNVVPLFSNPQINETTVFSGMNINHSITISESPTRYLFSWNGSGINCDTWVNSSWIDVSGVTITASNVSQILNACSDKTISWKFCANNTVGINCSSTQSYDVSSYGTLNVNISYPLNNSNFIQNNTNLTINATVTCQGGTKAKCGTVYALARYNLSASPDTAINTTVGANPFYSLGGEKKNYTNQTDGFSTLAFGSDTPSGITTNNSDFWITDNFDEFVYHVNRTGGNITDGFSTSAFGSNSPIGITTNNSDFWIIDSVDEFVYHVNRTGGNITDGFSTLAFGSISSYGITTNNSDFWITDYDDDFVYHVNRTGGNITDGFSTLAFGSDTPYGITTKNSDFWITDNFDEFVYHVNRTGGNITDGFSTSAFGSSNPTGITTNVPSGTPTDFWITDNIDNFVYHLVGGGGAGQNPQTSPTTLSQGQSWNISWALNVTNASTSSYLIDVLFNSSYGNLSVQDNNTQDRQVNLLGAAVDTEYPQFSNYWDNNASLVDSGTGLFNVTVTSTNGSVLLEINGNNITAKNMTANVYNASYEFSSAGTYAYRWHSWGNGTSTNYNKSIERSYTVNTTPDNIPPNINITYPINNTNWTDINLDINYTRSDDIGLFNCWYSNDTYLVNTSLGTTCDNVTSVVWSDAKHNVTVWANDSAGNYNFSTISFTIDATKPNINITFPINNSNSSNINLDINYTRSDLNGLTNCWYSNDTYLVNISLGTTCDNITSVVWTDAKHNVTVWANDSAGNYNFSTISFTIDTIKPNVNITYPLNNSVISDTEADVNYTRSDLGSGLFNCWYSNDTYLVNITLSSCENITTITWTAESHNVTVWANDSTGNYNWSTVNFSISASNPPEIRTVYNNTASIIAIANGLNAGPNPTSIILNFSAYDANNDFNDATATINVSYILGTIAESRTNATCYKYESATNLANYTCNVTMFWWDSAGTWLINASIFDDLANFASNASTNFSVGSTIGLEIAPTNLTWTSIAAGATNITSNNDPVVLNNTGNQDIGISTGNISINATDLVGETNGAYRLYTGNFSVHWETGGICSGDVCTECAGSQMNKTSGNYANITNSNLTKGNFTINDGTGQEELYFCMRYAGTELTEQPYSTLNQGVWTIRILLVAISSAARIRRKKKKKQKRKTIEDDKLIETISLLTDELKEKYKLSKFEIMNLVIKELRKKYKINRKDIMELTEVKRISIPATIFSKNLGALESLVKYMKENLNMSYSEIAKELRRNERTIWTAYKKATEKQPEVIKIKETDTFLPISIFENKDLTVLESIIIYLKEKGMKFSEIGKILERDERNIWTIYSRAVKKIEKMIKKYY